ncbi:MAG: hypothetical protein DRJ64_04090 [Thermoprotei archaeon]|nr:MAG: hypothetical protein DRJ64_04090 [Thermoprotei archaeon]
MIKLEININKTKLSGDAELLGELFHHLSFKHPNAFFIQKTLKRQWDGMVNPLTPSGTLDTGLLDGAIEFLVDAGETEFLVKDHRVLPQFKEETETTIGGMTLRDYQVEAIESVKFNKPGGVLYNPRGILQLSMNAGKCSCRGTLVPIENKGLVKIEEVLENDQVLTEFGYNKVTATELTGYIKTIYIETRRGYRLEGGYDNHKIKQEGLRGLEWSLLRDIEENTYIPISIGARVHGSLQTHQGVVITPDVSYTLGALTGDGSVSEDGIFSITSELKNIIILEHIKDVMESLFQSLHSYSTGLKINLKSDGNYNLQVGRQSSKKWIASIPELQGGSHNKRIPNFIFKSPISVQLAYLAGYWDTDGSIDSSRNKASITSVSLSLMQDTQDLLLNLGIFSKRGIRKTKWQKRVSTTNRLTLSGESLEALKELPLKTFKKAVLNNKVIIHKHPIQGRYIKEDPMKFPFENLIEELFLKAKKLGIHKIQHMNSKANRCRGYSRFKVTELLTLWKVLEETPLYQQIAYLNTFVYDIVAIKRISYNTTYDLEVANSHSYISNGLISHNSLIAMGLHVNIIGAKTLILLNSAVLYDQFVQDLSEVFPDTYGYMRGKKVQWGDIMVCMIPSLKNRLDEYSHKLLEYNFMVVDECDLAANKTADIIYKKLYHIGVRIGMTGTAFIRDLVKDRMRNLGMRKYFGEALMEVSMKDLEDQGISTPVMISIYKGNTKNIDGPSFIEEFKQNITANYERNNKLLRILSRQVRLGHVPILIVNRYVEQCELVYDLVSERFPNLEIGIIHTNTPPKEKAKVIKDFKRGTVDILVANLLIKRGMNFPLIRLVVNNSGGEHPSTPLQIIGRGVRKHESKKVVHYIDFWDLGKYLKRHSKRRLLAYKKQKLTIIKGADLK